jgi:LmbE family N-acetylglucosaminyl deacetylase
VTILFIFPHPDDETIFAGGTIARHTSRGDKVIWLCASYGEKGRISQKHSPCLFYFTYFFLRYFPFPVFLQRVAIWWLSIFRKSNQQAIKARRHEAEEVARIYGISRLHFLEIEDMKFGNNFAKLGGKIRKYIKLYHPQLIYTYHPNGITGHPDHKYLAKCVIKIAKSLLPYERPKILGAAIPTAIAGKYKLPLVGTEEISHEIELSGYELNLKTQAINAYISQKYLWKLFLEKNPELLEREYFTKLL